MGRQGRKVKASEPLILIRHDARLSHTQNLKSDNKRPIDNLAPVGLAADLSDDQIRPYRMT